jgi:hypothetical protein
LLQRRDSIPRSRSHPAPSKDINPYFLGKRKTVNLNDAMQNKEIEEEHHILPQIDAKKKDKKTNPTMRTRLDFKSAQFDHVRGEAEDWIKMRGLEI